MREQHGFDLWWRYLEAPNLDEFLLAIDDVPFLSNAIAVANVTGFEKAF